MDHITFTFTWPDDKVSTIIVDTLKFLTFCQPSV